MSFRQANRFHRRRSAEAAASSAVSGGTWRRRAAALTGGLVLAGGMVVAPLAGGAAAGATFLKTLAGPSTAAMYSSGLEFDAVNNRIVAADTGLDRILFYDENGTKLGGFGSSGSGVGQLSSPRDAAVDPAANIYVADAGNNRVEKFDSAGNLLWTAGGIGSCKACLNTPIGVTWDVANSVLLVASTGQSLFKAFDANGNWLWTSPTGTTLGIASPRDVTRGPDGRIWVSDYKHHQIKAYNVTAAGVWSTSPAIVLGDGKTAGHGDGQLNFPYDVAFSPDAHIAYVADTGNNRIARWDISGATPVWLPAFGGRCSDPCPDPPADLGLFEHLRRVVVDPAGNVIGDDFWGSEIQIFSSAGAVLKQIEGAAAPAPGFAQSFGVAVGGDGTTYGIDRLNQRIERFAADGTFLNTAGARGVADDRFSWPEAIAVAPDKSVWVADTRNDRLQHWPADLSTAAQIPNYGDTGSTLGKFNYPEGLTVDSTGKVVVADTRNDRIQTFDPAANAYTSFGSTGTGPGQFQHPKGVAVATDAVYVADTDNNRVEKLARDGTFVAASSVPLLGPEGVALADDGTVWVADTGNDRVVHLSSALADLGDGFGSLGTGDMQLNRPHSLALHGNVLFVADTYNSRVQEFTVTASPPPPPPFAPVYSSQQSDAGGVAPLYPAGGAADSAGNRYIADSGGSRIVKIDAAGVQTTLSASGWNDPRDIELDPDGTHMWVADTSDSQVVEIDKAGAVVATLGGKGKLKTPYGLSNDATSVFVADTYNNRVVRLQKSGGTQVWAQTTCGGAAFSRPRDVGVGSDGRVYVADTDHDRIAILDPATGSCAGTFGATGTGNGQFKSPRSLTSDGAGGLWVADAFNYRVQHVSNAGAFLGKSSGGFGQGNGQFRSAHCVFLDNGMVDVCDTFSFRLQRFSVSAGAPVFSSIIGGVAPTTGGFNGTFGAAYGPSGELYAVDWFNQRIQKFNPDGSFDRTWGGYGSKPGSLIFPRAVAVTPDGATVVVTDSENNRIDLFTSAGVFVKSVKPAGTTFLRPHQTALDPDGSYWVADTEHNRVVHLDASGTVLGTFTNGGLLKLPRGIALGPSGEVFVSNTTNNTVEKYDKNGVLLGTVATLGTGPTNVKTPYELTVAGPAGSEKLFVADYGNSRVVVLNMAGQAVTTFGSLGTGNGQLSSPTAVAVSSTGRIAVSDFANNRLSYWTS